MTRFALGLAGLSLAFTACGTTVANTVAPAGSGLGDAAGVGSTPLVGSSTTSTGDSGLAIPATGPAAVGTGSGSGGATAAPGSGGNAAGAPVGSGTTSSGRADAKPLEVGIVYYPDVGAFAASFGATASTGDQKAEALAAVKWADAHGGLAGHEIKPVFFAVQLTSSQTYDETEQQICASFTQDHHVVAALTVGAAIDNVLPRCLQEHHVVDITGGNFMHDDTDWQQYPYMFSFGEPNAREMGAAMVHEALSHGYVKRGDKVGLMVMDEPAGPRTADNVVKPMLAAQGISVTQYDVPEPTSTPDIGNAVAVDDSAELKMASQGIKTVFFLCPACLSFFAQNAQSQNYYPRYIITSWDGPYGLKGSGNTPSYKSALALGWQPLQDTTDGYQHPASVGSNPTQALCAQIEKSSGQITGPVSYFAAIVMCDGVLQLWKAAELNPAATITGESLLAGLARFGTSWASAMDFSSNLNASRHYGVSSYRLMHWATDCSCFAYTDKTNHQLS